MPFIFLSTISTNGSRALSVCVCWMLLLQPNDCLEKKADIRCMWEKVSTKCLQIELKWCVRNQQAANSKRKTTKTHKPNRKSLNCLWNYQSFLIRNIFIHFFFSLFWVIVVWGWNLIPISARVLCPTQCCSRKIIRPKKLVGFWQVPRRHIFIVSLRCTCCQSQLCMQ